MQLLNHQSVLAYSSVQWLDSSFLDISLTQGNLENVRNTSTWWTMDSCQHSLNCILHCGNTTDTKLLIKKAMDLPPRRKYQPQHSQGWTRNSSWNLLPAKTPCPTSPSSHNTTADEPPSRRLLPRCPNSHSTNVPFLISPLQHTPS